MLDYYDIDKLTDDAIHWYFAELNISDEEVSGEVTEQLDVNRFYDNYVTYTLSGKAVKEYLFYNFPDILDAYLAKKGKEIYDLAKPSDLETMANYTAFCYKLFDKVIEDWYNSEDYEALVQEYLEENYD